MNLGERMKEYEYVTRTHLVRRTPVIIRVDGKAFHTFTKGMQKPFDMVLIKTMQDTMQYLCENIQNCVLGSTQSDEITLVLVDYKSQDTSAWFDDNIQKMCSISAAMATLAFNKFFIRNVEAGRPMGDKWNKALFDSRVFNLPKEEVCNCLIWRQQDATRNSIQSLGQAHFSHSELKGKSCNEVQDMLMLQKGINWNDLPVQLKRGSCCVKETRIINKGTPREGVRNQWVVDASIPVFTQDRGYIESRIM